jgi:UDP-N-acetyl-2-amino-2-deoxyglucuronate dehydrogenase
LPPEAQGKRTFRSITIDGESLEFSEGFTDLHTLSYQDILAGGGFGLDDAIPAIQLAHDIRTTQPIGLTGNYHPLAGLPIESHPFH